MVWKINLSDLIIRIDQFGQGIELRIDKLTKAKTLLGGLLTIIMLVLLFLIFFFSAQDILYHTNPRISLEQKVNGGLPTMSLNQETFPISFSLMMNGNFALYKPEYFSYYISLRYGNTTAIELSEDFYNITVCKKEFFPVVSQEAYDNLNMNQNFCVKDQNFTLSGGWNSNYISYLSLRIAICTGEDYCAPYNEIEDYIKTNTFFWNIFYMNTNVNPQNFTEPVSYNIFNYYKLLKLGSFKLTEIYIRPHSLRSDEGFIFESSNYFETLNFDFDNYEDSAIDNTNTLVEFEFLVSPNVYIYHRNYMKIQEVLASVGGLANLLRISFVIICYVFSIVKRNELILNKIFEFDISHISRSLQNRTTSSSTLKNFKRMCLTNSSIKINSFSANQTEKSQTGTGKNSGKKIRMPTINCITGHEFSNSFCKITY
jgi:hypothetical protein